VGNRAELRRKKRELITKIDRAVPFDSDLKFIDKDTIVNTYNNQQKHAKALGTILKYIRTFPRSSYSEMKEALCDLPQLEGRSGMSSTTLSKNLKQLEQLKVIEAIRDRQPGRPPSFRFKIIELATPFVLQMILATMDGFQNLSWVQQVAAMHELGFTEEDIKTIHIMLNQFQEKTKPNFKRPDIYLI
jgi:DNA-binding HxlR family transcriptional regulator